MKRKYIFHKIKINLLSQYKLYIMLLLQLIFGVIIIIVNMNVLLSYYQQGDEIKKSYPNSTYSISWSSGSITSDTGRGSYVTYEDYQWIAKEYSDILTPSYYLRRVITAFPLNLELGALNINAVYAPDEYFEHWGYIGEIYNKVFVGENIYGRLKDDYLLINSYTDEVKFNKNNTIDIGNKRGLEALQLSELKLDDKTIDFGDIVISSIDIEDCIFIPCSLLENYYETDNSNINFKINFTEEGKGNEKISKIISQLAERHNSAYTYTYSNVNANYEWVNESIIYEIRMSFMFAIIVMMILLFGFTGLLHIITHKRRKQIAISIMLGGNEKIVISELLIEIGMLCFTGAAIGSVLGSLFTNKYQAAITGDRVSLFRATIHWESIVLVLIVTTLIAIFVVAITYNTIKRLQPIEILRSM